MKFLTIIAVAAMTAFTSFAIAEDTTKADREELVKKLKDALPKGWTAAINPQAITGGDSPDDVVVWREEKTVMRQVGLPNPSVLDKEPAPKPGFIYFKLLSSDKFMSVEEFRRLKKANDDRKAAVLGFNKRLKDIPFSPMLAIEELGPIAYKPRNDGEKALVAEFQKFWDSTPKNVLPDYYFKNLSLHFEDLRRWETPVSGAVNNEADAVINSINTIVKIYE